MMRNNSFLALLGVISIISLVNGEGYTYLSNEALTEEIGIDWWNILRADATCCPMNLDKDSCNSEAGSSCAWFPDPNNEIAAAAGAQCVGESFVKCKRRGGPTACCTPNCNGNAPAFPGGPTDANPGAVPPKCGPLTPAPTTPMPTPRPTPRPTTPAPVTPMPTTPAPVAQADACNTPSAAYNLQLILDESGSITSTGYDNSVDFVARLIDELVNEASPLSVYSFSNAVDELYRFDETQTPRDSILAALEDSKSANGNYQGRCTDTMSALDAAITEYERAANSIGDDLVVGNRFLMLITDGVPYCGCGLPSDCDPAVCSDDPTSTGYSIRQRIAALGIRLVVLGVGSFDITTIECLANTDDVFQIAGYTDDDFNGLVNDVKPILCGSEHVTPMPTTPAPVATPNPTPAPTPKCELGNNYNFEGQSCTMSGDPHTTMFNGNKHDFQGTPLVVNNGFTRNQFYYIHPCAGESNDDMPLKVAATHYHWGTRSVSGVDYLTIILTEAGGANQYYIYLSSAIASMVDVSTVSASSDYDEAVAAGAALASLTSGVTTQVGRRFKVTYTNLQTNYKSYLTVLIDDEMQFTVYMQAQTYSSHSGRYAMHYVQMSVPSGLKCMTCGLCGDFQRYSTGLTTEQMEACDGTDISYRAGWNPASTPEAFDTYGWTWEKAFVDNSCSNNYDNTDNIIDTDPEDPCDETIADDVAAECEAQITGKSSCCNKIGGTFCAGLLTDCKVDACAAANGDVTAIADAVTALVIEAIEAVCSNDDLQNGGEAPPPALQCPTPGSVVVDGGNGYNDISGDGLSSDRYNIGSIEDCELKCQRNSNCAGFSYAPIGGDNVYPDDTVCSIYSSGIPTRTHGPNQIFCKIVPRTCTLTVNAIVDDDQFVYRKEAGAWTKVAEKLGWGQLLTTTMNGFTINSGMAIVGINGGGPGGLIAKVTLESDSAEITDTYTWYSNNPMTTFRVTDQEHNVITDSLTYYRIGEGWGSVNTAPVAGPNGESQWISIAENVGYIFYFEPDDFTDAMTALGCVARAKNHNKDEEFIVLNTDPVPIEELSTNHSYYVESFGIVGLVLILCGAGLYWRKNKNDGYKPIKGIDSEEEINPFLQNSQV